MEGWGKDIMSQEMRKERNQNIDLLRIVGCLFVVMSHVSSEVNLMQVGSVDWTISHIFNSVGHTGTILFFMISGSLLLSEDYRFSPKKFYTNNFLRLFLSYYIWIVIYHVIGFVQRGQFGWIYVKDVIINVIRGDASYHFWYLPMLLGIYLLLPFLRPLCKGERWVTTYFVALFVVVQVVFGTILFFEFPHKYLFESLMKRIPFTLINHHVGYFVMGYFLTRFVREKAHSRCIRWGCAALIGEGVILGIWGDLVLSAQQGVNVTNFNSLFSITMCMSAVGFFVLFMGVKLPVTEKGSRWLTQLARLTFGVYMVHPLILNWVKGMLPVDRLPVLVEIPLLTVVVFGLCTLLIYLLSLIPGIKKWVLFIG